MDESRARELLVAERAEVAIGDGRMDICPGREEHGGWGDGRNQHYRPLPSVTG